MITKEGYDRIEFLRNVVNDGEDAKTVLRVIKKYREQIDKDTLTLLADETDKTKIADAISDYKAVVRLCDMLNRAVALAERKEKILEAELKKP